MLIKEGKNRELMPKLEALAIRKLPVAITAILITAICDGCHGTLHWRRFLRVMINGKILPNAPDGPRPSNVCAISLTPIMHHPLMGWIILMVFLFGMPSTVCGQLPKSEYERSSVYNLRSIKVVMKDGSSMTGLLVMADTGKLTLRQYINSTRKFDLIFILYRDIDFIKIRKRGAIGLGVALGGLAGGLVGGAVGNATEPSKQFIKGYHTAGSATGGVLLGGILGGVLCGIKGKYPIHGDKKLFSDFVLGLQLYKQ